jgi:hypothetical protein
MLAASERWEVDSGGAVRVRMPNFRGFASLPINI